MTRTGAGLYAGTVTDILEDKQASRVVCVTLFFTTVETVKDTSVLASLTLYRFSGHVSFSDW